MDVFIVYGSISSWGGSWADNLQTSLDLKKRFFTIVRRIHHPTAPLPLSLVPEALEGIDHQGMNPVCKLSILTWLRESCGQVHQEENLIQEAVDTFGKLFT